MSRMRQQSNGAISLGKLYFFGILMLFGNDYSNEDTYGKPYKAGHMHHILNVRYGRLLMDEPNIEALLQENNTLLEEKFMGSVDANGETYLQDRSDVTKHGDESSSRSRKSSPRDSSRKKSKSTMDRCNVDKSNESLNLNNFDEDQGKEKFGGSSIFGSTESLFEERDDDDLGHDRKVGESTHFGSMDSIFPEAADDNHVSDDTKIGASTNFDSRESLPKERNVEGNDKRKNKSEHQPRDRTGVKPGVHREAQRGCPHGVRSEGPYARETGSTHIEGIEQSERSNGMARKGSIFSRIANYIRKIDSKYQAMLVDILREEMEKNSDFNEKAPNFNNRNEFKFVSPVLGAFVFSLLILIISMKAAFFLPVLITSIVGSITYVTCRYKKALKLVKYEQSRIRMVRRKSKQCDTEKIE
ncbi:hypothetical protein AK88_02092 [Plasmodium fragile]|uniref:Pv-fam-d protein n=1 Tax=Plasmodium fragile TaxID=5857 RepID=A0A0D9QRK8_PLAFR|nr:uncharacterized protein AK88_02092 [Plasmodium fragile]KJP88311.1 hypothetical protein AK88_02092 [Plasmodium fragile]